VVEREDGKKASNAQPPNAQVQLMQDRDVTFVVTYDLAQQRCPSMGRAFAA
jgi:hypothetical protein